MYWTTYHEPKESTARGRLSIISDLIQSRFFGCVKSRAKGYQHQFCTRVGIHLLPNTVVATFGHRTSNSTRVFSLHRSCAVPRILQTREPLQVNDGTPLYRVCHRPPPLKVWSRCLNATICFYFPPNQQTSSARTPLKSCTDEALPQHGKGLVWPRPSREGVATCTQPDLVRGQHRQGKPPFCRALTTPLLVAVVSTPIPKILAPATPFRALADAI